MYMVTTGNQPTIFIVVAALIILLYNGKRGNLSIKYFFIGFIQYIYRFFMVHRFCSNKKCPGIARAFQ